MSDPVNVSADGENSTAGWRDHVRHPVATDPVTRTSPEPDELEDERAAYARRFRTQRSSNEA
jgi:hypothetical protein